jgi:hypothetical protein
VRGVVGYDLASRLWHWAGVWLGAWFPVSGLLAGVPVVEACRAWSRGRSIDDPLRARLIFAAASTVLIAAHLAMLAGVPWSSLEETDGFSLRYALPCAALLWLAACASGVSALAGASWWRTGAAFGVAAATVAWYVGHQGVPDAPSEEALARLTPGSAALGLSLVAIGFGIARLRRSPWRAGAAAVLIATVTAAYVPHAERMDARLVWSAQADLDRSVSCSTCGDAAIGDDRRAYLELLSYERMHGVRCAGRRVYITSRWDFPLELQSPRFENQVFDVHGSSYTTRLVERDAPGRAACDYVIATRAALGTTNGVALVNRLSAQGRLKQAADAGRFVVFAAR